MFLYKTYIFIKFFIHKFTYERIKLKAKNHHPFSWIANYCIYQSLQFINSHQKIRARIQVMYKWVGVFCIWVCVHYTRLRCQCHTATVKKVSKLIYHFICDWWFTAYQKYLSKTWRYTYKPHYDTLPCD